MDPAFSMRYTLVNVGAFIGTFLVGILYKDVFAKDGVLGFAPCFKMAALMMVLGGLWYIFVCWRFLGDLGKLPFKKTLTEEEKSSRGKEKKKRQEQSSRLQRSRRNVSVQSFCSFVILHRILDILVSGIYAGIFLLGREYGLGSSRLSGTVYMV